MKYLLQILFLFFFGFCQSQIKINEGLKRELDDILQSDQILREYSNSEITEIRKDEILKITGYSKEELSKNIWKLVNKQDSINLIRVENIISKYGYPGKSLVGEPTNKAVWYVIQHSEKIPKYFSLIQKAWKQKQIPFTLVAMMQDRMLMYKGEEQIYGTQGAGRHILNKDNEEVFFNFIWPIKNTKKVNKLREKAGFENTVEENAKNMGMEYTIFTLEDYKKLKIIEFKKH
ncbi:DUF6624 domain-containing protein [Flavobacterium sp.]|uniref:DUF6624 domain-containing protein n=1 Tax=Flavobacterium sp. TaxID=239 RepID=UPI00374CC2BF